jgi:hypothetical protein
MITNTHFAQFISPTFHILVGSWSNAAGQIPGTVCKHRAAGAGTSVVTVPVQIPSNSQDFTGCKLVSIELDYELMDAAATSVTAVLHKVARGTDTNVAVASHPTITQDLVADAGAATQDQHRLKVTLTTPEWIDNDTYFLCEFSFVCGDTVTLDIIGAVINYTFRA